MKLGHLLHGGQLRFNDAGVTEWGGGGDGGGGGYDDHTRFSQVFLRHSRCFTVKSIDCVCARARAPAPAHRLAQQTHSAQHVKLLFPPTEVHLNLPVRFVYVKKLTSCVRGVHKPLSVSGPYWPANGQT